VKAFNAGTKKSREVFFVNCESTKAGGSEIVPRVQAAEHGQTSTIITSWIEHWVTTAQLECIDASDSAQKLLDLFSRRPVALVL
jgi:hypothetical protein